jgi:hypothetical protein
MTAQGPEPRRGCLKWGCITGLLLLLVIAIAGLVGLHQARRLVTQFTDAQPATLPVADISPAEMASVEDRIKTFRNNVRAGRSTPPLALTAREINGLIATDPDLEPLKGKVFVTIVSNQLQGQVSLRMEDAGLPMFKGRFLNANGAFELALKNGILRLTARALEVKGRPLSATYMQEIRKQNLARNLNREPRVSVALDRLSEIKLEDGKLVIVPRQD